MTIRIRREKKKRKQLRRFRLVLRKKRRSTSRCPRNTSRSTTNQQLPTMDAASATQTKWLTQRRKASLEPTFPSGLWMDFKLFKTLMTIPDVEEDASRSADASIEENMTCSKGDTLEATGQILHLPSFLIRSSGRTWDTRHNLDGLEWASFISFRY